MMNDNARSLIVGATALVTGLCVGVGAGVLFAPHSGARTRRHLRSFAEDRVEDTVEIADKFFERGRRSMGERQSPEQSCNEELRWWFTS
jgi:gas vesicle protein